MCCQRTESNFTARPRLCYRYTGQTAERFKAMANMLEMLPVFLYTCQRRTGVSVINFNVTVINTHLCFLSEDNMQHCNDLHVTAKHDFSFHNVELHAMLCL